MLGKLPVLGSPTKLFYCRARPTAVAVGADGGLDIFLSSFSLSLGNGPLYTELLSQSAVKAKTTNQPVCL